MWQRKLLTLSLCFKPIPELGLRPSTPAVEYTEQIDIYPVTETNPPHCARPLPFHDRYRQPGVII